MSLNVSRLGLAPTPLVITPTRAPITILPNIHSPNVTPAPVSQNGALTPPLSHTRILIQQSSTSTTTPSSTSSPGISTPPFSPIVVSPASTRTGSITIKTRVSLASSSSPATPVTPAPPATPHSAHPPTITIPSRTSTPIVVSLHSSNAGNLSPTVPPVIAIPIKRRFTQQQEDETKSNDMNEIHSSSHPPGGCIVQSSSTTPSPEDDSFSHISTDDLPSQLPPQPHSTHLSRLSQKLDVKTIATSSRSTEFKIASNESYGGAEVLLITRDSPSPINTANEAAISPSNKIASMTVALEPFSPVTPSTHSAHPPSSPPASPPSSPPVTLCGMCEQHLAEIFCQDCQLAFCVTGGCNRTVHAPRKMRLHTRVPLRPGTSSTSGNGLASPLSRPGTGASTTSCSSGASRPGTSSQQPPQPQPPLTPNTARLSTPGASAGGRGRGASVGGGGRSMTPSLAHQSSLSSTSTFNSPPQTATGIRVNVQPSPSPPATAGLSRASTSPGGSDEDEDPDDTAADARLQAAEARAAALVNLCDQCHVTEAVVFCIDCHSALCDAGAARGGEGVGCNRRIHKARTMARHRQVRIEERDDILEQLEKNELHESARTAFPEADSVPELGGAFAKGATSPKSGGPRPSFIAPLGIIPPARQSVGGFGEKSPYSLPSPSSARAASPSFDSMNSRSRASSSGFHSPGGFAPRPPPSSISPGMSPAQSPHAGSLRTLGLHAHQTNGSSTTPNTAASTTEEPEFDPAFTDHAPSTTSNMSSRARGASTNAIQPSTTTSPISSAATSPPPPSSLPSDVLNSGVVRQCDNCEDHFATCYCSECKMYLCTEGQCQQLIHRPAKMKAHSIFLIASIASP